MTGRGNGSHQIQVICCPAPAIGGVILIYILYETTRFSALHKLGSTAVSQEKDQAVDKKAVSKPVFQPYFSEPCLNTNVCKTHRSKAAQCFSSPKMT